MSVMDQADCKTTISIFPGPSRPQALRASPSRKWAVHERFRGLRFCVFQTYFKWEEETSNSPRLGSNTGNLGFQKSPCLRIDIISRCLASSYNVVCAKPSEALCRTGVSIFPGDVVPASRWSLGRNDCSGGLHGKPYWTLYGP